ncbi:Mur ligase [Cantharellus anzutake]|uniref:Mur ligase n=1 Tax=Cantharellus anzutake TaxID=1750568 RepID=UPI001906D01D|nr:Mur ligase [Cantharellus anzutake]KAF8327225.1 Mur ligase [Cantharellus anzutake]
MSIDLGLDRIKALLEHIPYARPTIHVVGTNGKGSVSSLIEHALLSGGLSVGKFTSPHLVHAYDCISINGQSVSPVTYERLSSHLKSLSVDHEIDASPFEFLTATALSAFEEEKLDVVILEAGMGGRLDATNALPDEVMLITVITAIDFDHQAFLGDTISSIAREKAGVIREHGSVVLGDQSPESVAEVLQAVVEVASQQSAKIIKSKPATRITEGPGNSPSDGDAWEPPAPFQSISLPSLNGDKEIRIQLPLLGEHQLGNAGVAYEALKALRERRPALFRAVSDDSISNGFGSVRWLGRLSWTTIPLPAFPPSEDKDGPPSLRVLVDGAHNEASSQALSSYLESVGLGGGRGHTPRTFIVAFSHSPPKTPEDILKKLLKSGDRVALIPFKQPVEGMPWVRNAWRDDVRRSVTKRIGSSGEIWEPQRHVADSPFLQALHWARRRGETAIIAGSLYLAGDFYREFGIL